MNTNLPEQYTQDYKYLNNQIEKIQPKWLNEIRNKAFSNLSKIGFPTQRKGNEKWKYTNISKLAKSSFSFESEESPYIPNKNFITNDSDWTNLIFLNGKLLNNISNFQKADNNITISKFTDALKNPKTSQLIKTHLSKYSQVESDGFTSLNTAFINDGILINIHQDTHITKPIHISFISHSNETPTVSYPRILIIANKNSSSNIIESYIGDSKIDSFTNSVSEIV